MSRQRYEFVHAAQQAGDFILAGGAAAGLCVALFNYFRPHNGIDGTWGALLVVASTALVFAASLILVLVRLRPSWRRASIIGAILLGLIGTVAAAYFLESIVLIVMMALAFLGWVIRNVAPLSSDGSMAHHREMAR